VLAIGLLLATAIEMMQLFVLSRYFDATDIISGGLAVLLGWRFTRLEPDGRSLLMSRGSIWSFRLGMTIVWTLALMFIHWSPFDFRFDQPYIFERMQSFALIPFAEYYSGNYLNAFNDIIQKTLLFAPLGMLLNSLILSRRPGWIIAIAFVVAGVLELGQLFLPSRNPGITDLLIEPFGAWLGYQVSNRLKEIIT
jgi:glycopeptide antibiotics resistance protein